MRNRVLKTTLRNKHRAAATQEASGIAPSSATLSR